MPAQKDFSANPQMSKPRSVFNRSHSHKSTFNVDDLVPFYVDEILPGDSQEVRANIFARLSSTLQHPIMDNIHLDTFYFFVPYRILWDNWEKFMGAQDDPGDSIAFTIPQMTEATADEVQSLMDYMGVPPGIPYSVSSLFARAYIRIYNEFFRDENLQDSIIEFTGDGPETEDNYNLQKRGKRFDYFTSCLPTPQKGDPVQVAALSGTVPVWGSGYTLNFDDGSGSGATEFGLVSISSSLAADSSLNDTLVGTALGAGSAPAANVGIGVIPSTVAQESGLEADLTGAGTFNINDLRLAIATQQLLELDNRGGTRYFEILKAHFGVISPDARLQRPEYLGGSTKMININPVSQTTASPATPTLDDSQGNQAAYATGGSQSGYSKSFVEHGCIIGLVNVRADLTYQQGINRMFHRSDRYDFYFPSFANLGEQAVLQKEIWADGVPANDDTVFGYNEAWSEYRYKPSLITGRFRSDVSSSLDSWHLSEDFASAPVLNSAFITEGMPINRVLTVPGTATVPHVIFDSWIQVKHARCMPVYSIPGLKRL